jgi:asparagine synthase (glutamine-hydrolysing)
MNHYQQSQPPVQPTWSVAWGSIHSVTAAVWQDDRMAVVGTPATTVPLALSPSQRFVVTGEVWLSCRDNLLPLAAHASDLEQIAAAWERWGVETLDRLVGVFGLVVWDRQRQELWLSRDRVGGRTLYYTTTGTTRYIAPNLRSLNPYRSNALDWVALRDYLCCAFVPGERTLWQQVRELRPGTVLKLPGDEMQAYWHLQEQIADSDLAIAWHGEQLRTLLEQVVQEALPANEPVGVFLSGGLDSSCVTALAAKFHPAPVHTYSIHFGSRCANELEFSSLVAQHCATQHHILEIPFDRMWEQLPETMAQLDDPIGDPLTVPNLLVGRLARESVQVVLNGEGGDPCFGGPKNQPMLLNQLYSAVSGQDALSAYLLAFQKCAADLPRLLKPEVWTAVRSQPSVFSEDLESQASYLNRLMALNIKFKGADQILTKVNNLTKAAQLHARSPLFDSRIVELSLKIPPEYKLSGVQEKAVLKQAVADLLPPEIIHRPKSGMMVPVQLGFREYWHRQAKGLLLNRKAAIAPYFDRSVIQDWLNYRGDTWGRYGIKLWLLVSLELWLQAND